MIYDIEHEYVSHFYMGYVLLPLGLRINTELKNLKMGDSIRFSDGTEASVVRACVVDCKTPLASMLCAMKYSKSLSYILDIWQKNAQWLGDGLNYVDRDNFLCIFYKKM
jgi:hypothetical protein